MATTLVRKTCAAGNGCKYAANFNCEGCSQAFCTQHVSDHRRMLGEKLNEIIGEHNDLKHSLIQQTTEPELHPLTKQINDWEENSINKVRQKANEIRKELAPLITVQTTEISKRLREISEQLSLGQDHDDFIETDLDCWKKTLDKLKLDFASPSFMVIDNNQSVPLISNISITRSTSILSTPDLSIQQSKTMPLKLDIVKENKDIVSLHDAYNQYKCIVNDILTYIKNRQYKSVSYDMVTNLDPFVKKISQILLKLGVSSTTTCFYGLPLSTTEGNDGTPKTTKWIDKHTTDHWIISSVDSLWCAWRQDATYFQVIMAYTCSKNGFETTLQRLEALVKKYQ